MMNKRQKIRERKYGKNKKKIRRRKDKDENNEGRGKGNMVKKKNIGQRNKKK